MINYTLSGTFERSGVGLHSGILTKVRVLPASPGEGRYFARVDLPGAPIIPARLDAVHETRLSTELRALTKADSTANDRISPEGEVRVRTVEHLLAALACSGVDDARIEIDGPEVPLLDGSAKVWVEAIQEVGVVPQGEAKSGGGGEWGSGRGGEGERGRKSLVSSQEAFNDTFPIPPSPHSSILLSPPQSASLGLRPATLSSCVLKEPVWIHQGDTFVAALPAPTLRFTYGIDFELAAIGNQWHSFSPEQESFAQAIAPARTFGLLHQIEQLRQAGLIKGGSLDNALVCSDSGWLNPPLRFSNEPVRHKLLDLVGDLSLLGTFPVAHFLAYKASHNLHVQLAKALAQQMG